MSLFHRHKWIVLNNKVFPSPYDEFLSNGGTRFKADGHVIGWFDKRVVTHYKCETCGTEKVTG